MSDDEVDDAFVGRWCIVSKSAWAEEYLDEEKEGFFAFNNRGGESDW